MPLELLVESDGGRQRLLAPAVGLLTCARAQGELLAEGQECGVLLVLGRAHTLLAPPGTSGRVANAAPERVHAPLGFGDLVYELEPLGTALPRAAAAQAAAQKAGGLVLRAGQSGRFYLRPSPADAPFVQAGDVLSEGTPVGLIEVMKTFTQVVHRAADGLPARARVRRYLVADGADVKQGQALLELEAA